MKRLNAITEDLWEYLKKATVPVVMYGTGNGADKIIDRIIDKGIALYGIFASDDFARGQIFRGYTVKKYSDFKNELTKFIVIVSFASQRPEVLRNIYSIAEEQEVYAPDVPVYGDGLFDLNYFKQNQARLEKVYEKLADDLSKETFINSIQYKLTGKISYLRKCETTRNEVFNLLHKTLRNYNYIDIGAYNGDTLNEYVSEFSKNNSLYAFEPDEKNYKKLIERCNALDINCICYNMAAWNTNEILEFSSKSGRSSTALKNGSLTKVKKINAVRIDSIIQDRIGFIKIDAEGSDKNAVLGLENLIHEYKPCLKIAAYHRNEDFFDIPEIVSSFNSNFKLYMRHLPYVPCWDTDYIFVFND